MKLTDEELNRIMAKADDNLDELKMKNHELYEENEKQMKYIAELLVKINKLESRIDKTIDFINNYWKKHGHYESIENCLQFCDFDKYDLLKILQGVDKE